MNKEVELLNYKKISNGRSKIGELQIRVSLPKDTIIILNKLHHVQKNGEWVNYPVYEVVDDLGNKTYSQYLIFEDKELENKIRLQAFTKLKDYLSKQNQSNLTDQLPYIDDEIPF